MATMYCALCRRPVEAKRHLGAGTVILAVITGGAWLVTIPFYSKRCAICKTKAVSTTGPGGRPLTSGAASVTRLAGLEQRLTVTESELDAARDELDRLRAERDFYRELLGDRVHEAGRTP